MHSKHVCPIQRDLKRSTGINHRRIAQGIRNRKVFIKKWKSGKYFQAKEME